MRYLRGRRKDGGHHIPSPLPRATPPLQQKRLLLAGLQSPIQRKPRGPGAVPIPEPKAKLRCWGLTCVRTGRGFRAGAARPFSFQDGPFPLLLCKRRRPRHSPWRGSPQAFREEGQRGQLGWATRSPLSTAAQALGTFYNLTKQKSRQQQR